MKENLTGGIYPNFYDIYAPSAPPLYLLEEDEKSHKRSALFEKKENFWCYKCRKQARRSNRKRRRNIFYEVKMNISLVYQKSLIKIKRILWRNRLYPEDPDFWAQGIENIFYDSSFVC
ncbi:unnamed protein product [Blepharisma stoltei]|uniref:Uncharacterized protein n=1 Tax=Blepharisma stoltei TaxID=1481888 RepID=A0AAU9IX12_9CILI|nr:unnamed protein product [Blepharisma stoltei]